MSGVPLLCGHVLKHQLSTSGENIPDLVWVGDKSHNQPWWPLHTVPRALTRLDHLSCRPLAHRERAAQGGSWERPAGWGIDIRPDQLWVVSMTDFWRLRGGRRIRGLCLSPTWQNIQNLLSAEPGKDPHGRWQRELGQCPGSPMGMWLSCHQSVHPPDAADTLAPQGEKPPPWGSTLPPPAGSEGPLTSPPQCGSGLELAVPGPPVPSAEDAHFFRARDFMTHRIRSCYSNPPWSTLSSDFMVSLTNKLFKTYANCVCCLLYYHMYH